MFVSLVRKLLAQLARARLGRKPATPRRISGALGTVLITAGALILASRQPLWNASLAKEESSMSIPSYIQGWDESSREPGQRSEDAFRSFMAYLGEVGEASDQQ
jgi:hypothetical protein